MLESEIIDDIKILCQGVFDGNFDVAIGDDCAVRKRIDSGNLLLSADISIEDVHFSRKYMSLYEIGYKSAVSNLSDIAAMGATPDFFVVSLAFPASFSKRDVLQIYEGIAAASKEYRTPIVGGDLSKSDKIVISITIGGISGKRILRRNGAKTDDNVWVCGYPGMSGLGFSLLQKHGRKKAEKICGEAVWAHIHPKAQIELGKYLADNELVHSCIDISDGVAKEIRTIAKESGAGAQIFFPKENAGFFFNGGEDYELLWTADKSFEPVFEGVNFSKIGEITAEKEILLIENGVQKPFEFFGFEHF